LHKIYYVTKNVQRYIESENHMIKNRELAHYAMQKVASNYLSKLAAEGNEDPKSKTTIGQKIDKAGQKVEDWYNKSKAALIDFYKKHGDVINRVGTDAAAFGGGSVLGLLLNRLAGNKSTASKWIAGIGGGAMTAGAVEGARYLDAYLKELKGKADKINA
jgi:hypothetical protein